MKKDEIIEAQAKELAKLRAVDSDSNPSAFSIPESEISDETVSRENSHLNPKNAKQIDEWFTSMGNNEAPLKVRKIPATTKPSTTNESGHETDTRKTMDQPDENLSVEEAEYLDECLEGEDPLAAECDSEQLCPKSPAFTDDTESSEDDQPPSSDGNQTSDPEQKKKYFFLADYMVKKYTRQKTGLCINHKKKVPEKDSGNTLVEVLECLWNFIEPHICQEIDSYTTNQNYIPSGSYHHPSPPPGGQFPSRGPEEVRYGCLGDFPTPAVRKTVGTVKWPIFRLLLGYTSISRGHKRRVPDLPRKPSSKPPSLAIHPSALPRNHVGVALPSLYQRSSATTRSPGEFRNPGGEPIVTWRISTDKRPPTPATRGYNALGWQSRSTTSSYQRSPATAKPPVSLGSLAVNHPSRLRIPASNRPTLSPTPSASTDRQDVLGCQEDIQKDNGTFGLMRDSKVDLNNVSNEVHQMTDSSATVVANVAISKEVMNVQLGIRNALAAAEWDTGLNDATVEDKQSSGGMKWFQRQMSPNPSVSVQLSNNRKRIRSSTSFTQWGATANTAKEHGPVEELIRQVAELTATVKQLQSDLKAKDAIIAELQRDQREQLTPKNSTNVAQNPQTAMDLSPSHCSNDSFTMTIRDPKVATQVAAWIEPNGTGLTAAKPKDKAEPVERPPTSPNNPGLNDNPATPNTPATAPTKPGTPENGLPTPEKVADQPRPPRRNPPRRRLPPERYRNDAPPPHKPPTARTPGRSRNHSGTNLDLKQVLSGHPGSAVPSDPDPIQDPPGHLGPAVPSGKSHLKPRSLPHRDHKGPIPSNPSTASPTTTAAKTTTVEPPKCGPSALQNADPQPSAPRRNPARRRLQPERYPGNLYNSHKPLSAQERRNAAAYDKMVAIRDRMATPPTAGPSGRNHPPPPTSNPGPTQDPPGHLGPVVPSVGAPSNRKPAGDRHGRVDLGAGRTMEAAETEIQKLPGTVGTSDLSGSRDPSEPPVGPLGPSGFPGTQVTSRTTKRSSKPPRTTGGQSLTTTEPPNHKTINTPDPPGLAGTTSTLKVIQPGRGHLGPLGFPGTRVVSPTPSDPHQHAHNHDQPGRKSPHLGPPFPEPER
nr:nascent polypeptide-associated complex subunit alpha, muscle-specific form-like [Aedes albopictus]